MAGGKNAQLAVKYGPKVFSWIRSWWKRRQEAKRRKKEQEQEPEDNSSVPFVAAMIVIGGLLSCELAASTRGRGRIAAPISTTAIHLRSACLAYQVNPERTNRAAEWVEIKRGETPAPVSPLMVSHATTFRRGLAVLGLIESHGEADCLPPVFLNFLGPSYALELAESTVFVDWIGSELDRVYGAGNW